MGEVIWTEKYRPQSFKEVKGQEEIVSSVEAFVKKKNMPHLLFAGPAGVGKSTLALVIAKELFGSNWKDNFLELNASDERGIDVIRVKVKDFARTKAIGDVPFKIIFLDECDALTKEAQNALRRTMENYTATCRFILSCNYSSKIIDPIQSRCAVFRFKPLPEKEFRLIIKHIAKHENLEITKDGEDALIEVSEGDCRRMENILQACSALYKKIDENKVYSVASYAKPKEIEEIITLAFNGKFIEARELLLKVMLNYGLSGLDLIKQIQSKVWNIKISDEAKLCAVKLCGEVEFRMVEGSDEFIQLEALLANLALLKK